MARAMNRTADYQFFYNRSQNYRNVWDAKENFYCGRYANGSFVCPDNKLKFGNDFFIEGSAWQYRFYGEDPGDVGSVSAGVVVSRMLCSCDSVAVRLRERVRGGAGRGSDARAIVAHKLVAEPVLLAGQRAGHSGVHARDVFCTFCC